MRVLIYVEPFPIRNSLTHFDSIAKKFLPLLRDHALFDIRMFANAATLATLGNEMPANSSKRLISPTPEESRLFESYKLPWQPAGVSHWLDLMHGRGRISNDSQEVLRRVWQSFPFEIIIHWGENGAVSQFLEMHAVTRIAMELGCTRPPFLDSIVMDPFGTNGATVVPKLSLEDIREIVDNRPMSRHDALLQYSQNLAVKGYEEQFVPIPAEISSQLDGAQRIAFLPLQLFDDANLLRFSGYQTIEEVVREVVPKLASSGYKTIVKPHPASKFRTGAVNANAAARAALRSLRDQVVWCDADAPIPNARLVALSNFVVTVNSSVGFEALYFDKPVVVLGDAAYKPRDLFPSLDDMLSSSFDEQAFAKGAGLLRRFLLGGYLQPAGIFSDATAFMRCVGAIDETARMTNGSAKQFAQAIWRSASGGTQAFARSAMFWGLSSTANATFTSPASAAPALAARKRFESKTGAAGNTYLSIVRRLHAYSGAQSLAGFLNWLDTKWRAPEGRTELVRAGNIVDTEYYLELNEDVRAAQLDPIEHFARHGIGESRAPQAMLGVSTVDDMLSVLRETAATMLINSGLTEYPLTEREEESRQVQLGKIGSTLKRRKSQLAVVAHLYYRDLVPEILESLRTITESFDLIVTVPDWGAKGIVDLVLAQYPKATVYSTPNRGRDIAPFLDVLPLLCERDYSAVLKVQTKRGYYENGKLNAPLGEIWRIETMAALLGSEERVNQITSAFRADKELAMVGPSPYWMSLANYPHHDGGELAQWLLGSADGEGFFAGTMFWFRPSHLQPFKPLSIRNFPPENGASDGALAHLVERAFGQAAIAGGRIAGAPVDPSELIEHDFQALQGQTKLHDYLKSRHLDAQRRTHGNAAGGHLIW
ncbi:hypothetical protein LJR118_005038 [Acidovorax sp. LjRoot118]|uniref:rhamnan synthesis F family protein n=1 Tax=Acidovorax sp. LjRoot118 TaxID=3342256 RepID=UPI003ED135CD